MARFYTDENFPLPAVEELGRLGHDVLTSFDSGNANAAVPDAAVLAFATEKGRILLTHNRRHFLRLHNQGQGSEAVHAGIVVCTFDPDFAAQARRIDAAATENSDMTNKLLRINRNEAGALE